MASRAERAGSPLADGWVATPRKISIQDDKLLYMKRPQEWRRVDGNILRDFIGLRSGDVERNIITFAKKYGTLQLCKHGTPMFHNLEEASDPPLPWECREIASTIDGWDFEERLAAWRGFSLQPKPCRIWERLFVETGKCLMLT
jgi:hypothetical protein